MKYTQNWYKSGSAIRFHDRHESKMAGMAEKIGYKTQLIQVN